MSIIKTADKILIIYTGGTIGMDKSPISGLLQAMPLARLLNNLPEINIISQDKATIQAVWQKTRLDFISFKKPIDSSAVSIKDWQLIASTIYENYQSYSAFVVLHGTDTMAYSGSALSFMFAGLNKAIVFTGSNYPLAFKDSDAKQNFFNAVKFALRKDTKSQIWIAFENYAIPANLASKTGGRQFYEALKSGYKKLLSEPDKAVKTAKVPLRLISSFSNDLLIVYITPAINTKHLAGIFKFKNIKSYILLAFGAGNAMPEINKAIVKALNTGKKIAMLSQTVSGHTSGSYATSLLALDSRIIDLKTMSIEAAYTKLLWANANVTDSRYKNFCQTNQRGELG